MESAYPTFPNQPLSKLERASIIQFMQVPGFGERTFWQCYGELVQQGLSWMDFWQNFPKYSKKPIFNKVCESIKKSKNESKNTDILVTLQSQQISVCVWGDSQYPFALRQISYPPPVLYYQGTLPESWQTALAVIGSRRMTGYGRLVLQTWLPDLVKLGCVIVSGASQGVDQTAATLTLQQHGSTVAVLGHGLAVQHPRTNQYLYDQWRAQGACLLSSFAPLVAAQKGTFLARNRIVAGLCPAVLVVEAAAKSGTKHTVDWAAEFGKHVLAVPGSVFNQFAQGTAAFINSGALVVTSVAEIWAILQESRNNFTSITSVSGNYSTPTTISASGLSPLAATLLTVVRSGEMQLAQLLAQFPEYSTANVLAAVSQLELRGLLTNQGGWYFSNLRAEK